MTSSSEGDGHARTDSLLSSIPILLLCVVALHQVYLVHAQGLSPWKGGGFGMFSTTDSSQGRRLRVTVSGPAGEREIDLPDPLWGEASLASILPSERRLRALAQAIAANQRRQGSGPISRVDVSVSHLRYDPRTLLPQPVILREHSLKVEGRSPAR
jgi:hypothetical protein